MQTRIVRIYMYFHELPNYGPNMIVCVCHNVSDRAIRAAMDAGATSLSEIRAQFNVGTCCGKCIPSTKTLVRECNEEAATRFTTLRRELVSA
jgi:bacterioferritin-associated ferredoxin